MTLHRWAFLLAFFFLCFFFGGGNSVELPILEKFVTLILYVELLFMYLIYTKLHFDMSPSLVKIQYPFHRNELWSVGSPRNSYPTDG